MTPDLRIKLAANSTHSAGLYLNVQKRVINDHVPILTWYKCLKQNEINAPLSVNEIK